MEQVKAVPRWLHLQRTGLILYAILGVLLLVYALGFITNVYLFYAYGNNELSEFYQDMQWVNAGLLMKAIYFVIFACVLFLLSLAKRSAGLVTLGICLVIAGLSLYLSFEAIRTLIAARQSYMVLDLSSLNRYIERGTIQYRYSSFTYELGLAGYGLFFLSALFMAIVVCIQHLRYPEFIQKKELQ